MEQADAQNALLAIPEELTRIVKEGIPLVHASVYPLQMGDNRATVITTLAVGDAASKEFDDVVITLHISPLASWRAYHPVLESHGGAEVAVVTLEAGSGRDLADPLIWPLPGAPGSSDSDQALLSFADAAKELLRESQSLILDVLRQEMRDEGRR